SVVQNGDVYTCFQQNWIEGCEKPLGNLNHTGIDEILASAYAMEVNDKMKICNLPCKVLKCNTKN
ncbi:MAG: SPASM domain-containing protein, partial [Bacteroidia bacterium]|nr:SPASM domain-containing protein [Bacteroidia bacterium]